MAEAALTSIAKSALQLFTSLAKDEFLLQWKSQKELERLEDTIETVSCFLQDVDKLQSKELSVQNCLARLRKVMYEADDFFDALAWQALHEKTITGNAFKKEVHLWFSKLSKFKIAHEVKAIRESLECIKADMVTFGFISQSRPIGNQRVMRFDRDKTHSFVHEEDVIGRDKEKEDVVNLLLPKGDTSDGPSFSVVAVIGFGGLGKTTLAQLVYNDERVKQGFDVCLWSCVNDLSNLEQVLIEIIASREGRLSNLGLEKLQEKLREIIGRKKFLVVLDDVWDEDPTHWLSLEPILRCGKVGSKVLVRTRSQTVADSLDASKPCRVDLGGLSDQSAWSLFVNKAFRQGGLNEHPELEPIGRKIVSSCGNVPLAIVVVGSLIRQREKKQNIWSHFLENELEKALSKSDGDGSQKSVKDVLMVSYSDLLPHLKLCFAYCSLFPKDYLFDKDELVRLWLAQGFVKPPANNDQSLEEEGEECFFHLVERCFFQQVRNYNNEIIKAKMHDLVHDVAIDVSKARSTLFDKDSINKRKRDSLHHISIDSDVVASLDNCNLVSDPNTVRTLLHLPHNSGGNYQISQGSLDMLVTSFRLLRTLSLPYRGIINVSSSIGEPIHLRYLDLSHNKDLKHLPKSICKLHHLMTLTLRHCQSLEELPPKIGKLVSSRQLYIYRCDRLDCLPRGLTTLTSLVTLDRLIVHPQSGGLGYLEGLDELRGVLTIELPKEGWPCAVEDAKRSNMSKKHKLDGLVIKWKTKGSETAQEMGKDEAKAVLEALEPHQRLEHLDMWYYDGEKLPGWLCMLENVKKIHFFRCERVEYIEDVMRDGSLLPSLETLKFNGMQNLKGWWRHETPEEVQCRPCLAKVSRVEIYGCPELRGRMPVFKGVKHLRMGEVDVKLVAELLLSVNSSSPPQSCFISPCDIGSAENNKLNELALDCIEGLICLPEGWVSNLTALQSLEVSKCRGLQSVSRRGLSHLTALKQLKLGSNDCEIGDGDEDSDEKKDVDAGMPWKALRGLERLILSVGDRHLHEGLAYLSCLTHLEIKKWKGVQLGDGETGGVQLPSKALQNLGSLEIGFDNSICHLPKAGIQHLHSLKYLTITGCKELYLGWKTLLFSLKLQELILMRVDNMINVEDHLVVEPPPPTHLRTLKVNDCKEMKWVHHIPWKSLTTLDWLIRP